MLKIVLLVPALVALAVALPEEFVKLHLQEPGEHWAVLVAGSNTFANYHHQADVCHAYQVLLSHGFEPDHIITILISCLEDNIFNAETGSPSLE